jgi:hypothetical protein
MWLSDTLCRLATGEGYGTRQLYTDSDEVLFDGMRPIILNGIETFIKREDLADRSISLVLADIPEDRRRAEAEFWSAFEIAQPRILGALLDVVSHGLRALPSTKPAKLPRMADFAQWVAACEGALWEPGTFADLYDANRDTGEIEVLNADPLGVAVQQFMAWASETEKSAAYKEKRPVRGRGSWMGTAAMLLGELNMLVDDAIRYDKQLWPKSAAVLGGRLRRIVHGLARVGIELTVDRNHNGREITLRQTGGAAPVQMAMDFGVGAGSSANEAEPPY